MVKAFVQRLTGVIVAPAVVERSVTVEILSGMSKASSNEIIPPKISLLFSYKYSLFFLV
jgi:hypothetical protein